MKHCVVCGRETKDGQEWLNNQICSRSCALNRRQELVQRLRNIEYLLKGGRG